MHFNLARWLAAVTVAASIVLSGCGSPPPPAKKADKEISEAKSAISSGDMALVRDDYANAIADYKRAREIITKAKSFAKGTELTELKELDESARKKYNDAELKSITYVKPVVAPPPPKETKVALVDPAEAKKKEEEAKRKAREEEKKKIEAALTTSDRIKPTKIEDEPVEAAAPKKPQAGADGEEAAAGEGEEKPKAVKMEGPFPEMNEKSPEIQIVGHFKYGNYLLAYCQAYNKRQDGRRIATVVGFFKDGNNQVVIPRGGTAAFPYAGFSLRAKDMIADQPTNAILGGTHQITGMEAFRFVVVAEGDKIKDVKKVVVQVNFDDGDIYAEAPLGNPPAGLELPAAGGATKKK